MLHEEVVCSATTYPYSVGSIGTQCRTEVRRVLIESTREVITLPYRTVYPNQSVRNHN